MQEVRTKTGKTFECDYFVTIPSPPICFARVKTSLATAASVFANPEETAQLWYMDKYLAGFTKLMALNLEDDFIKVSLMKE